MLSQAEVDLFLSVAVRVNTFDLLLVEFSATNTNTETLRQFKCS